MLHRERDVAIETALEAGQLLLDMRESAVARLKVDKTLVTDADDAASKLIVGQLRTQFPDYGILDEEALSQQRPDSQYCWVTDPLDDTRGYKDGTQDFGVIFGLLKDHQPVLGVTFRPLANELLYAVKGEGAYRLNLDTRESTPISVSKKECLRW